MPGRADRVRPRQLPAHEHRQQPADDHERQAQEHELNADDLVIRREQVLLDEAEFRMRVSMLVAMRMRTLAVARKITETAVWDSRHSAFSVSRTTDLKPWP